MALSGLLPFRGSGSKKTERRVPEVNVAAHIAGALGDLVTNDSDLFRSQSAFVRFEGVGHLR